MKQLSIQTLATIAPQQGLSIPPATVFTLPEKILQFGTGVLLRGLPDYFIDEANKQGVFNGRIVVVKSTSQGGTDAFASQDGLFTHCIRGLQKGEMVSNNIINASVSRVLSATGDWQAILECATNPAMEVVISNTTEVGIVLNKEDSIDSTPPASFPGKLLAFLFKRYQHFNGDAAKGMVIIPTELIVDNGAKLLAILVELAHLNNMDDAFKNWLQHANHFCSSLVDRIVPGRLPKTEEETFNQQHQYCDELMIMSEPYALWAIEAKSNVVRQILLFSKTNSGVVIAPDITRYRELKLRLLNGTHTLSCGLAHLAGFTTVHQAMNNEVMAGYIRNVMLQEIAQTITGEEILQADAIAFANDVLDRFANPYIQHQWLSITMQYSGKMKMRNVPTLLKWYERKMEVPPLMALGFAAYIAFMNVRLHNGQYIGECNGHAYTVNDDRCAWFANLYTNNTGVALVETVLKNVEFWEADLSLLPGFVQAVYNSFNAIAGGKVMEELQSKISPGSM